MNLIFKEVEFKELGFIAAWDKDINLTPWTYNDYVASYNNPHNHIVIIIDNDTIVGSMTYSIIKDEAEILQLFILKDYQKKGYGYQALELFINQVCIPNGIAQVLLEVRSDNIWAQHLYSKLGFVEVYVRVNYYKCGDKLIDAKVMLKSIIC